MCALCRCQSVQDGNISSCAWDTTVACTGRGLVGTAQVGLSGCSWQKQLEWPGVVRVSLRSQSWLGWLELAIAAGIDCSLLDRLEMALKIEVVSSAGFGYHNCNH